MSQASRTRHARGKLDIDGSDFCRQVPTSSTTMLPQFSYPCGGAREQSLRPQSNSHSAAKLSSIYQPCVRGSRRRITKVPHMAARALLFDVDGTLVDSNEYHVSAWHEAFLKHAREVPLTAIRKQIGKGSDQLIPALLRSDSPSVHESIDTEHGEIFRSRYLSQVKPFPGATELLRALHRLGVKLVLASSAKPQELDYYVDLLGIASLLAGTVTSQDVNRSKPAGDIFRVALEKAGPISATQTLAVGDTVYDVQSAQRSSIETIALRSGTFSDEELQQAGALAIYDDVAAILGDLEHVLALSK
jgi:phosphoglycolate phosphatase-like HAD superfamily hydrolase